MPKWHKWIGLIANWFPCLFIWFSSLCVVDACECVCECTYVLFICCSAIKSNWIELRLNHINNDGNKKIEFVFDTRLCKSNLILFFELFFHKFYGINDKKNLTRIHQSEHIKAHIFMNGLTTSFLTSSFSSLLLSNLWFLTEMSVVFAKSTVNVLESYLRRLCIQWSSHTRKQKNANSFFDEHFTFHKCKIPFSKIVPLLFNEFALKIPDNSKNKIAKLCLALNFLTGVFCCYCCCCGCSRVF